MRASIKSIFYRLLLSYSLIGTLPLAVACLLVLVWGNTLVVSYVQNISSNFTERVAEEIDETVLKFTTIGENLSKEPAILKGVSKNDPELAPQIELELYKQLFAQLHGDLTMVEVHVTSSDGLRQFSSTEFPRRYDFTNQQVRDLFISGTGSSGPHFLLAPGPGSKGNQIAFSIWFPIENGVIFIDVRTQALKSPLQIWASSKIFLVDRVQFSSLNLLQPHDPTSFSEYPDLGIVFTEEYYRQPTPHQLVHRRDLTWKTWNDLSVIMITELSTYFDTLRQILLIGLALVAGTSIITSIVSVRISRSISRPIDSLIQAMTSNPQGPLPLPEPDLQPPRDELEELTFHYNRMVETIASLIQQIREEEQLLRETERRALQAQIQPHFLYNTLGAVKSMAKLGDFEAVSAIVTDLGKIMRFSLSDTEAMVPVSEITEQVQRYLNIQKIRFQDRIIPDMDLDPNAASVRIPKLIIEPLIENAVMHGVEKARSRLPLP